MVRPLQGTSKCDVVLRPVDPLRTEQYETWDSRVLSTRALTTKKCLGRHGCGPPVEGETPEIPEFGTRTRSETALTRVFSGADGT